MLLHDELELVHIIWNSLMNSLQPLEMSMYGLGSVLTHESCSNTPPLHPRYYVLLHYVKLREHSGSRKFPPVELHESLDVTFCFNEAIVR